MGSAQSGTGVMAEQMEIHPDHNDVINAAASIPVMHGKASARLLLKCTHTRARARPCEFACHTTPTNKCTADELFVIIDNCIRRFEIGL